MNQEATRLPELIDCRGIMAETGLKRTAAEKLMRKCPRQHLPDTRKWYVRRSDIQKHIDDGYLNELRAA